MAPARKIPGRIPPSLDVPLLTDVVEADAVAATALQSTMAASDNDALGTVLTERVSALADRLLRDAAAELQHTLLNQVREKLREEIPALVAAALKEARKS